MVWTGTEMIIWGGSNGGDAPNYSDGGAYNPTSDSWRYISAPNMGARRANFYVWTGTEMLLWGGWNPSVNYSDGMRYDPATDTWSPMATYPGNAHEGFFTWTGTEMLIFGGHTGDRNVYGYTPPKRLFVYTRP